MSNEVTASSISLMISWLSSLLEKVLSDAVGFALLGLVIALLARNHISAAIEKGLRFVAKTLSEDFGRHIVPEIVKAREAAEKAWGKAPRLSKEIEQEEILLKYIQSKIEELKLTKFVRLTCLQCS